MIGDDYYSLLLLLFERDVVIRPVAAEDDDFGFIPIRRNDGLGLAIKKTLSLPLSPQLRPLHRQQL